MRATAQSSPSSRTLMSALDDVGDPAHGMEPSPKCGVLVVETCTAHGAMRPVS